MNTKYEYLLKLGRITGIYIISCKLDDRTYTGKSTDVGSRFNSHINMLGGNRHHCSSLQEAWNKYGPTNFSFEIVEVLNELASPELLSEREIHWWKLQPNPYNGKPNRDKYAGPTPETRKKISKAKKGKRHLAETKLKISEAGKGKVHSAETKQKIAETMKGKTRSEEHKQNLSKALSGKTVPEETRKRMSKAKKGKKQKPLSEETKQKISEAKKLYWAEQKKKSVV